MIFKLRFGEDFATVKGRLKGDQRLTVEAMRATAFYAEQSAMLANFIRYLELSRSIIFSVGAVIGAMIAIYASPANRTTEIGTLRALGVRSRSFLAALLLEALLLGAAGGALGLVMASFVPLFTISTLNWTSFSELVFSFTLDAAIVSQGGKPSDSR